MTLSIPTTEPTKLYAGDTWNWNRNDLIDLYPASSWELKYTFDSRSPVARFQLTASANGEAFSVVVVPATTAAYTVSDSKRGQSGYYWVARAEHKSDGRIFTAGHGELSVSLALSAQTAGGYDPRIWAEKALDSLRSVIEGRASEDQLSYSIAGISLQKMSPEQLRAWHAWFNFEVNRSKGRSSSKSLRVEFGRGY